MLSRVDSFSCFLAFGYKTIRYQVGSTTTMLLISTNFITFIIYIDGHVLIYSTFKYKNLLKNKLLKV